MLQVGAYKSFCQHFVIESKFWIHWVSTKELYKLLLTREAMTFESNVGLFFTQKTFLLAILLNKFPEWPFLRGSLITNDFLQFKNWIICILLPPNHIIQKTIKLIKIPSPCSDNIIFNLVIGAFDNISTLRDYSLFVRKNNASKSFISPSQFCLPST